MAETMNETKRRDTVAGMGEGQDEGAGYQGARVGEGRQHVGRVVQVSEPAVDVQFDERSMPGIYQALRVVSDGFEVPAPINVILEVQQHIGDGRARCVR
jgi:F-type H+-transporting ATPase subunit beta